MNGKHLRNCFELLPAGPPVLKTLPAMALTAVLSAAVVACSGPTGGWQGGTG
jgi:hypothetical protein